MQKISVLLFGIITLTALGCTRVYEDYQEIKDLKWYKKDAQTFHVKIPEDGNYNILFFMRHTIGFPFKNLKIYIKKKSALGEIDAKDLEIPVIAENKNYLGDVAGELWDITYPIWQDIFLKAGTYTFSLQHAMNSDPVVLLVETGLIIEKAK